MAYYIKMNVTGHGTFPFDMLRRAEAWPTDAESVECLTATRERRTVQIAFRSELSYPYYVVDRFKSFGWDSYIVDSVWS